MNAVYRNDAARGEGYGLLRISDAAPGTSGNPALTFSLQRSSDGRYLGHTDWQDAEEQLVPDAVTPVAGADGDVELGLSPAVVDQLDALEAYRLTVRGEGLPMTRCVLELSGIIYSRAVSGAAVAVAPKPVPVQPAPTPEPEPIEPIAVAEPEPPLTLRSNEPAPKKSSVGLIILALLVLALLAGGGWYLLRGDKTVTPEEQTTPPVSESEKKLETPVPPAETPPVPPVEPKPEPVPPAETKPEPAPPAEAPAVSEPPVAPVVPVVPATPPPAPLAPKAQVRAFMQSKGSPQQALELARTLSRTTSEDQDAVFLLMEMAAEGGVPEAMLETARYYNPADTTSSGSIVKDAEQAFVWYTEAAAKAGTAADPATVPAIADGLASLREWLQKQAESGSFEAASLLKKIQ